MNIRTVHFVVAPEVGRAIKNGAPVVALESAVITHGLPAPHNLAIAQRLEAEVRRFGAVPATIAVIEGKIRVGLEDSELEHLAGVRAAVKVARQALGAAIVHGHTGGTTVAATMQIASRAGIRVFSTGGIGGVHRGATFDISGDLQALAQIPMIVVCAGAKAILDLAATVEYLETACVPVLCYATDEFPAFISRQSGLPARLRADTPAEIVQLAEAHWGLDLTSALLVANPIPEASEIARSEIEPLIEQASLEAQERGMHGSGLTPFLLQRVNELSGGRSVEANLALLLNNATLAAQIATAMKSQGSRAL
jgi:pseudouridine-5'-phosphate glycosidase